MVKVETHQFLNCNNWYHLAWDVSTKELETNMESLEHAFTNAQESCFFHCSDELWVRQF